MPQKFNRILAEEKRLQYKGTAQIVMPEKLYRHVQGPGEGRGRKHREGSRACYRRRYCLPESKKPFPATRSNLYDRFMSSAVNPIFIGFL